MFFTVNSARKLAAILEHIAVFPLVDSVLFPGIVLPLHIFEPRYQVLIDDALATHSCLVLSVLDPQAPDSGRAALCEVGCVGRIIHFAKDGPTGSNVLVQGVERVRLIREHQTDDLYRSFHARAVPRPDGDALAAAADQWARLRSCVCSLGAAAAASDQELVDVLQSTSDPLELIDILSAVLVKGVYAQQKILASTCLKERLGDLIDSIIDAMARYQSHPDVKRAMLH